MASESYLTAVTAFLASYRDAFERRDVEAIGKHFGDTVHVASDTGSGVHVQYVARGEWRGVIEQLVSQYEALDIASAEIRSLEVAPISSRLVQARVQWALFNQSGSVVYEFAAAYTLSCADQACRTVAVAHDEVARARRSRADAAGKPSMDVTRRVLYTDKESP